MDWDVHPYDICTLAKVKQPDKVRGSRRRLPFPDQMANTLKNCCQHLLEHSFQTGDWVWLAVKHLKLYTGTKTLSPRFIGLCEIVTRINPVTYYLRLLSSMKVHPVFHVSQLKHHITSPHPLRIILPTPIDEFVTHVAGARDLSVSVLFLLGDFLIIEVIGLIF